MPEQDEGFLETQVDELIEQVLTNRPDIAVAKTLQTQFRLERRIAENLAKPRKTLVRFLCLLCTRFWFGDSA